MKILFAVVVGDNVIVAVVTVAVVTVAVVVTVDVIVAVAVDSITRIYKMTRTGIYNIVIIVPAS